MPKQVTLAELSRMWAIREHLAGGPEWLKLAAVWYFRETRDVAGATMLRDFAERVRLGDIGLAALLELAAMDGYVPPSDVGASGD